MRSFSIHFFIYDVFIHSFLLFNTFYVFQMLYSCFIIQSIVFESEGIIFSTQKFSIIACAIALQLLAQCIQAGSFGIRFSKSFIEILLKTSLFLLANPDESI